MSGEGTRESAWPLVLFVGLLTLLMPVATLATDGNLVVALAPFGAMTLLYLLWRMPLRYPALVLIFLGLTLENPGDGPASGLWKSPLYTVGALLLQHWNITLPYKPLIFSGVDLLLVLLFGISWYRRATRSRIDGAFVETASPMRFFCAITIFTAFFLEAWGAIHGGMDFRNSLWQIQRVAYLPLLFFLFHYAFRGPKDNIAIAKTIGAAAVCRSMAAWGIRHFVTPNSIEEMPYATSHTDSMLFGGVFCLCIVVALEVPNRRRLGLFAVVMGILVLGMLANNRRLVWVEIAISLMVLFVLMPMTKLKRRMLRVALVALPLLAIYVAVGWEKTGGVFKVAQMVRSILDSKSDASTEWRDWENFDLIYTLKSSPILGVGYGHPYLDEVKLPEVNYELEHFVPHNSILGLWAYGGLLGFSLLWMMMVIGAFFAARSYRLAKSGADRATALASTMMFIIYLAHCYGDLGLGTWTAVFLVSVTLSVVGKLALTTGAWPSKEKAPAGPPVVTFRGPTPASRPPAGPIPGRFTP